MPRCSASSGYAGCWRSPARATTGGSPAPRRGRGGSFEEDALGEEIREIHAEHRGNYGALRVHAELRGFGHTVNHKRVARPISKHGIVGRHLRKKKRTLTHRHGSSAISRVRY
ncbi:IS3 family transposase [Streptomyces sp. NBC_00984]|uniref:IS3 family transposase n=1 Tax=Streptomyces sp. NBC_00984 TaxID=2903700 RepID=UPI003870CAD0